MRAVRRFYACLVLVVLSTILAGGSGAVPQSRATKPATSAIEQNNIGVGYMNQFLFKEASAAFRKALEADSSFGIARVNLGIALLYNQELDEAIATLDTALAQDRDDPYIHYCLGLARKNKGESEQAAAHFLRTSEIDPADSFALYNLGVLYARQRKESEAETILRRALALEPNNTSTLYNLGSLLLKAGRTQEGNAILERFRTLQQQGAAGGGMGVGNQYGEMGTYALARDYLPIAADTGTSGIAAGESAPFVDRTAQSGIAFSSGTPAAISWPWAFARGEWTIDALRRRALPRFGGGVALSDLDNDGDIDAVITRFDAAAGSWQTVIYVNDGKGKFTSAGDGTGLKNSGGHLSAAIGDYDGDGLPDIYLAGVGGNRLYRNQGQLRFEDVTTASGVSDGGLCLNATFVDYDHDGDLDLYVSRYADVSKLPDGEQLSFPASFAPLTNRMYRNNGDGSFLDHTEALGVGAGIRRHLGMIAIDVDNDRDVDLIVLLEDAAPLILRNDRNDRFTEVPVSAGTSMLSGTVTVADLNRDGRMDLLLNAQKSGSNVLLVNQGAGSFSRLEGSSPMFQAASARVLGAGFLDFDNDGDLDLYQVSEDRVDLWQNRGDGVFVFGGRLSPVGGSAAASADLNGDGRADIVFLDHTGGLRVLHNESRYANNWVGVRLDGLRSNKAGIGAKVEIRAGDLYQKFEIAGSSGYLSQDSAQVWLGLGSRSRVDTVTVRWPSGILQSEINVAANGVLRARELDRKGTSCPLLYTWNGKEFEFVTDFLGGSAYGYLVAPGRYNTPDTDEYIRIESRQLVPKEGKYLLNLNNQLEEIIMFDQARLLVVDHPEGSEIYPNERLLPSPPFPEHRIYTARGARPPRAAKDQNGADVLPLIARLDREYPRSFRALKFKGYAEEHSLTLDLGDLSGARKVLLLMDAWIDYADSSANLAAAQAGVGLVPPYLQVKDASGNWRTVIESMGFPAGLPKTMTVDLTGKFLTTDAEVRIVTSMRIYWDRIRVDTSPEEGIRVTHLDPFSADLHFRGYPAYFTPDGKLPWIYDYGRIRKTEFWGTHTGDYTRFGDVRELLLQRDDKYAITRHGDEVSLAFDAASAPPLSKGWTRTFLLYAAGFGKDMDLNSLYPEIMGPLPFHAMSSYPYPDTEKYPDDEDHREYRRNYNTRSYPMIESLPSSAGASRRK